MIEHLVEMHKRANCLLDFQFYIYIFFKNVLTVMLNAIVVKSNIGRHVLSFFFCRCWNINNIVNKDSLNSLGTPFIVSCRS